MNNNLKKIIIRPILILALVVLCSFLPTYAGKLITDGKGMWINIWNYPANPDMFCEYLKSNGIDTIYLQISRSTTPAISNPIKLNQIIKSAHSRNMKVIGWTYSFLKEPLSDAEKFIKAVFYKTPEGDSLDGMAADIEEVTNSRAIEIFASTVRKSVGFDYPLIAITFSPLSKAIPKNYAWGTITNHFDIIAPMTYWHGLPKLRTEKGAYNYTAQTIKKIKEITKKDNLKIHLIGDGQQTSRSEITGFLKAANDYHVNAGVSIYPWYTPKDHQVEALGRFEF